jgi:acetyl-CoA synthetase
MGNIRLTGRVDDVMKVAGHRLSTAEVENALTQHPAVAECAVVAQPHDIKGEVPVAFVTLKEGMKASPALEAELVQTVTKVIGPTARPEKIVITDSLPKTRSGKIMRRILKALVKNEPVGDTTTLMNPEAVDDLKKKVAIKA